MKKYLTGFILAAVLAASAFWWFNREPTLVKLQKQYLFAKTDAEREKVIDRLEQYYLNLKVTPALSDSIDHDFAGLLKRTTIDLSAYTNGKTEDKNPYALENGLKSLVRNALLAYVRNENEIYQQLMDYAHKMAIMVDAGTQNNYWVIFVKQVSLFGKAKAEAWLKADLAQTRCKAYQDSESRFTDAEFYASLGLKFLQQASDERLQLDIVQRLQYILYFHRSMNELSLGLAQKLLPQAEKIKYHLREEGVLYHQAEALSLLGQNQRAFATYDTVIENAKRFGQIANLEWFVVHGLLGKGQICLELGEFEEALESSNEVETHQLTPKDRIRLQILKGNIHRSKRNYEQAEKELQKAMILAEAEHDTVNLIICFNNFGVLFERLQEYDLALDDYNKAKYLCKTSSSGVNLHMIVLNNIADVAAVNDPAQFEAISQEAGSLLKFVNIPSREAELRRHIGSMYKNAKKYGEALEYFQDAASIYNKNGFLLFDLGTRIDIVDCLIGLSRFNEAKTLLSHIESLAQEIDDIERVIEAIGRRAKIQGLEGKIAHAIESSNQLLHAIEVLSSRFNNVVRLMAYRQKIHDFLKSAITYEIALQHLDSAFVKLAYAKAYALKNQLTNSQGNNHERPVHQKYLHIDSVKTNLNAKSLLVDYMVMEDTLYAFVLDREELTLLSKNINMETLKKTVEAYKDSISRTIHVFQHYDSKEARSNYVGTVELGQELYQALLGWPELESRLQHAELLYIIPDEFLFEIPFATLIARSSDSRTFVVNHAAVLTLPSADFLQVQNTKPVLKPLSTQKVLISADQRFLGVEKFVSKVKTLFPLSEELMVNKSAFTEDDVLAKLQENYQIYIFIGHGQANQKYPDRGYIELSVKTPNTPTSKIIRLTMVDLKKINWLDAEMVMLVGCETASGKLYRGTGISGLYQSFLSLGAQNVLGNLWEVDASHAIAQTQDFLTKWAAIGNPSQALRECQLKALQELEENSYYQQPYPYFWGSSILSTTKHP